MALLLVVAAAWAMIDRQRITAGLLLAAALVAAVVPAVLAPILDAIYWPLAIGMTALIALAVAWVAGRAWQHWRESAISGAPQDEGDSRTPDPRRPSSTG